MLNVLLPVALILLLLVAAHCQDGTATEGPLRGKWVRMAEHTDFTPRDTAEDFVLDGKMWISNAYHNGNVLVRDLWNSSDGMVWTKISDATPYDGYSEMAVYKGKVWAVKGSVWNSPDGINWTQVCEKTPFGVRGYGELVVFKDELWQLGSGADVWRTSDGMNWTCVTDNVPFEKRYATAVTVFKDKLWVMAGSVGRENNPPEKGYKTITTMNDVWCSADGVNWECVVEKAPWPTRMWSISKVYDGYMWLIGGYRNAEAHNLGDVWYTADGKNWYELKSEPMWSPRHEATVYDFDGYLWVVAGNSWPLMNDSWRLELER
ncbi:MAG: hypothetical protein KBI47_17975 [Armatimonadetes bacterium]|nr:hypothetical protein [Armatimonadota bacterium]MDI9584649.1 hypothetical protein [Acidobacteriota bacterium]